MCENPPSHTLPSSRAMRALVLASLALCAPPTFKVAPKPMGHSIVYTLHTRKAEVIMQGYTLKHPPVKLLYQSTMTKHCTSIDFLKTLYTKGQIHNIYIYREV